MKKEEILKRAQGENNALDERESSIYHRSFGFGMTIVAILCVAFSLINALQGQPFYEFGVIIFTYLAAVNFYQYANLGIKANLFTGIICSVGSIGGLIGYLILG